jgi:murein DD-endopeptidase MepM/ murein hydrolase activator NlpD
MRILVALGILSVVFGTPELVSAPRANATRVHIRRGSASLAGTVDPGWVRPVPGAVVVPFDGPEDPYAAGHRVADLAAPADTPVRAAGAGTVGFVGTVVEARYVVIQHAGNRRTSYSDLATYAVATGQTVEAGEIIGTAAGPVLHFGFRVGEMYIDPMRLFAPLDLRRILHLVAPRGDF